MHKVETFDPLPHEEFADLARRFVPRRVSDGQVLRGRVEVGGGGSH